jgi:hypothetical protein
MITVCVNQGGDGGTPPFYPDLLPSQHALNLLKTQPDRYKRCNLKIERSHKAIAKVNTYQSHTHINFLNIHKAYFCQNICEFLFLKNKKTTTNKTTTPKTLEMSKVF